MRVERIICPSCGAERKAVSNRDNLHNYSEEVVSEVCSKKECREWYNSPEQRLLRAIFGDKNGE